MRPLRLEIECFGSFAQRITLDFTRLGRDALFLIHGPTGAGKTTLLDAISFALFGTSSGEERKPHDLRSHHAATGAAGEVILDFSLGEHSYRVTRRPEYERPKARGHGVTRVPATAILARLRDDHGAVVEDAVLAEKWTAVTEHVERLVGFTGRQFCQVVVLPQGRFRDFLAADSRTREEILAVLFGTDRLASLQEFLKTRAAEHRKAFQDLELERRTLLDAEDLADEPALAALRAAKCKETTRIEASLEPLDADVATASRAAEAGRETARKLQELGRARSALAALEAGRQAHEANLQRCRSARHAQAVEPFRALLAKAAGDARAARDDQAAATTKRDQAAAAAHAAAARLAAQRDRGEERGQAARAALRLVDLSARLPRALTARAEQRTKEAAARTAEAALAHARREYENAASAAAAARVGLSALERLWHDGAAGRLAATLIDDQPCPVCGSVHHPAPAGMPENVPAESAVETARETCAVTEAAEARARRQLDLTLAEHATGAAAAAVAAEAAAGAVGELPGAWLDAPTDEAARTLARGAVEAAERHVATLDELLDRAQREDAFAREALAQAEEAFRLAVDRVATTTADLEAARESFRVALAEHGFADAGALAGATLSPAALADLENATALWEQSHAAAADRAARAADAAQGLVTPDLGALEGAEAAARLIQREASVQCAVLRETLIRLDRLTAELDRLATARDAAERQYRAIGRLADVANGLAGTFKITFQRFVLATLLDLVLDAASRRLSRMTRGRYLLRRAVPAKGSDRRSATGLDLEVDDAWTGQTRPVATLSGGEGFMASLALALGLSDVVQARAGGIRLDAVFIDEGFGTLDADALDQALGVLADLRQDGRMVGIVSHVQELRERIDVRLEVSRGERGSTARFVLP